MKTIHQRHYGWDNSLKPVLTIRSGQTVEFEVQEASGGQISPSSSAGDIEKLSFDKVNPVTGPVYIEGAEFGDVLEVEIRQFKPQDWGWTAIIPGFGLLHEEFTTPALHLWGLNDERVAVFKRGLKIPLAPFPGTIGVALPEPGNHSIVPPRQNGGNMDIRHLTVGTRLLLPVWVEGALFSVGDTHAAQGDGEVCGTAIESPMDLALKFKLHKRRSLKEPQFITPGSLTAHIDQKGYHVTTGFSEDLMDAAEKAVRYMIDHLSEAYSLTPEDAYMLCSVAVDLKISEIVDVPHWLVSAYFPLSVASS